MTNGGQPAGWHPDPWGKAAQRWWDGQQWTEHTDGNPAAAAVAPAAPPAVAPTTAPWSTATGPEASGYGAAPGGATPGYGAAPGYGSSPGYGAAPGYGAPGFGPGPTMPPPGGATVSLEASRNLLWVVVAGVAMVVLGSLLPWASVTAPFVGQVTVNGMDGDGPLTLIGGAVVGGLMLATHLQRPARWKVITSIVFAALVTLVAVIDIVDVNSRVAEVQGDLDIDIEASIGFGLWLVLLGGIVATVGCALTLPKLRRT